MSGERQFTSAEEKERFVRHVFDSIAPNYDGMNSLLSFGVHKRWRKTMFKMLNVKSGMQALDVACGTGDLALALSRVVGSTGEVVGLDFSSRMLEIARQKEVRVRAKGGSLSKVTWVEGSALKLPFSDGTFDVTTIGFALRNVPDIEQTLSEMQRVVRPGGWVASLELSKPVIPGFKTLYYLYFEHMLPYLGKIFARQYESYRWLPESLKSFPDHRELGHLFEKVGLKKVRIRLLTGGIAAIHIGQKPLRGG
ncbi:MAG: 2-heptaprenyl-1,4-naphthoquinone methyltransferase [Candidatus Carbobacillus altaicus]|uniref:Demethylmenaquinone methyltransferase n=1 Tax=Candidatus Carbonibacillus altaicus TaxID=2163959 RepID=A0A2R6Y1U3_9BACL|nr:MAG: 2-heptaprenyl-1,4-naphthoquinone methyltransferase [Candidatus Carbobacillus altaicus]